MARDLTEPIRGHRSLIAVLGSSPLGELFLRLGIGWQLRLPGQRSLQGRHVPPHDGVIPEPISSDRWQSMENQTFPTLSVISDRSELSGICEMDPGSETG